MKTYTKNNASYWERKVVFQTPAARTYSVQIQHARRRAYINLGTSNREEAGALALRFYQELKANGWDDTLRRRLAIRMGGKSVNVTIGQYLDAVRAKSAIHAKTLDSYAAALRKIAGDIHNVTHNGKRSTWRERVDAIKLDTLTSQAIEKWRADFIGEEV